MELLVNMRSAIIRSGKTRKQIAKELGISYNHLWRLLKGQRGMKADIVAKFASIMGKSPNDLYGDIAKYSNLARR